MLGQLSRLIATTAFPYGAGLVVSLLIVPALGWAFRVGPGSRLLAIAVCAHLLPMLVSRVVLARFLLPVLPACFVLVGLFLDDGIRRLGARMRPWAWALVAVAALPQPPDDRSSRMQSPIEMA